MPVVEAISVIVHCSAVSRNWGAPLNFWKPSLWGLYAWNLSVEVDSSFQKLRGAPQFLKTSSLRTNAWNFGPFWQGKTPQKPVKKVLWPHDIYKKYLLQKKWVKTAIPALSSGQSNLHQPIWGCHRQLDDQHRNPNNNDRDHLVGQLTTSLVALTIWQNAALNFKTWGAYIDSILIFICSVLFWAKKDALRWVVRWWIIHFGRLTVQERLWF